MATTMNLRRTLDSIVDDLESQGIPRHKAVDIVDNDFRSWIATAVWRDARPSAPPKPRDRSRRASGVRGKPAKLAKRTHC